MISREEYPKIPLAGRFIELSSEENERLKPDNIHKALEELAVDAVQDLPLLGRHGAGARSDVLLVPRLDGDAAEADFAEKTLDVEELHDDADRACDVRGERHDAVTRTRDVVPSRRGLLHQAGHDRDAGLLPEAGDLVEMVSVQTNSGWDGYDGHLDGLEIELVNGNIGRVNFENVQPVPAAVMACRYTLSCTSPQAHTPSTEVRVVPGVVFR